MTNTEISTQVQNYKGNNGFINSLQGGLKKYGKLTERQLSAAGGFFSKLTEPKKVGELGESKVVNVNLKISKFIAKRIAEDAGLEFKPFLVTVSKVLRTTNKAYEVVGRMNTSDVTSCRCCGKDLTDWRSQATGVGPICSKSLGIPYVKKEEDVAVFKKLLKLKIDQIGDLTFWVPKSQIKEGLGELKSQLD
jgi:hypothetical protein